MIIKIESLAFNFGFNETEVTNTNHLDIGTVNSNITFYVVCNQYSLSRQNLKLKSLIMAQIERWRQA